MQKYVFLGICIFVLGYFQGINGGCATPGCTCPKIPDTDVFNARVFAFIAKVTDVSFIPQAVPTKYISINIFVEQVCKGTMPIENKARLDTLNCPHSHAFTHLQVNQYYFFYGTYKNIDNRRSFVVDRCGPPCRPTHQDMCPESLDKCHN